MVRGIARVPAAIWRRIRSWFQQSLSPKVKGIIIGVLVTLLVVILPWWYISPCHHSLNPIVQSGIIAVLITLVMGIIAWQWISQWYNKLDSNVRGALIGGVIALIATLAGALIAAPGIGQTGQTIIWGFIGGFVVIIIILLLVPYTPPPPPKVQGASTGIAVVLVVALLFFPVFDTWICQLKEQITKSRLPPPTLTPTPAQTPTSPTLATATATNTPTHTATPMPSVVKAFLVTKRNSPIMVEPGTTITATVQEIVQIKAEVSTTYEEQEEDLMFTWYTCKTGDNPVRQSVGNPEMLYVAPSEPGSDCICVVVEKGGTLLDRTEIFVDVQK